LEDFFHHLPANTRTCSYKHQNFREEKHAYAKKHLCTTNITGNPEEPAKTSIP
jgi:hypothetical protein